MFNRLYEPNDINNNNKLVSMIFSGIKDFKKKKLRRYLKKKEKLKSEIIQ